MNRVKKRLAYLLAAVLLFALIAPAAPEVTAFAATKNPITELGIEKLPEGNTIQVGDIFNFNPDIIATERGKGKTTGVVWWEVNQKTNTTGVTSSRWGYVYPVYEGSFEIRALAFASKRDMESWKAARSANGNVADEAATASYVTAMTDWVKIDVVSDTEGYAVVRSQHQLNLALKNKNVDDIHIITEKAVSFTIASKNYTKRTLTVDAPNAEVENAGRFAQINIEQIKASTFTEKAYGNRFYVTAPEARIIFLNNARTSEVVFAPEESAETKQLTLVGEGGTLSKLNIKAAGKVDIIGDIFANRAGKAVTVNVAKGATGTSIKADTALVIAADADVILNLSENAAGTTVTKGEDVEVDLSAESTVDEVYIRDIYGKVVTIKPGENSTQVTVAPSATPIPSMTPTPSVTPMPNTTPTTAPSYPTPTPTSVPTPTSTPTPTSAPEPTEEPAPTSTPEPTEEPTPVPTNVPIPTPDEEPDYFASYTLDGKTTEIKFEDNGSSYLSTEIFLPSGSASKTITITINGDSTERELHAAKNYVNYIYDEDDGYKNYSIYFIVPLSPMTISASLSDIKISPSTMSGTAILNIKIDDDNDDFAWFDYYWEDFRLSYDWKQGNKEIQGEAWYQKEVEIAVNGNTITYTEPESYLVDVNVEIIHYTGGEFIYEPFSSGQSNELKIDINMELEKHTPMNEAGIGDIVVFGSYEQNGNLSDGMEDIEWVVLDKQDGKLLLCSKYALDNKSYNEGLANGSIDDSSWEKCPLRTWLNDDFYNLAFTESEKACIAAVTNKNYEQSYYGEITATNDTVDKVFLLSLEEMQKYFPNQDNPLRGVKLTQYARIQGGGYEAYGQYYGIGQWWLRTNDGHASAWSVAPGGDARTCWVDNNYYEVWPYNIVVRPVLWINISDVVQE